MAESPKTLEEKYPNWQTDKEIFEKVWQDLLKIQEEAHSRQRNVIGDPSERLTVVD